MRFPRRSAAENGSLTECGFAQDTAADRNALADYVVHEHAAGFDDKAMIARGAARRFCRERGLGDRRAMVKAAA